MRSINNEKGLPRREYWQELVSQQEQSGLSVHAFRKQRDVTEASFYNWRKQLRNNTGVGFALVDAQGKADKPKAPVELVLATGDRVQIAPGVDAATLRIVTQFSRRWHRPSAAHFLDVNKGSQKELLPAVTAYSLTLNWVWFCE
jgi:hypothetical protein